MKALERLSAACAAQLRAAIADADGDEVLAMGKLGADGKVEELFIAARGDEGRVPALPAAIERGDVIIHNHPDGPLRPSEADLAIAVREGSRGVGSFIVDNAVERLTVVVEPVLRKKLERLDAEALAGLLGEEGPLPGLVEGYEPRPGQQAMLRQAARAFNAGQVLVAEAGTGVGKSLAYLLPAFAWAAANGERVVVSTGTINLQQQIVEKDIPLAKRILGCDVKAVLVKGRGNYLCRHRLEELVREEGLFLGEDSPLAHLARWAEQTPTGALSDLPFALEEGLWPQVRSEADTCFGLRCAFREECFVMRLKREAAEAGVVVVNHHLLFADLAARGSGVGLEATAVLPPFRRVIIDEAHAIEESATSFFSRELYKSSMHFTLSRLRRARGGAALGLLPRLSALSPRGAPSFDRAAEALRLARAALEDVDAAALSLLSDAPSLRMRSDIGAARAAPLEAALAELRKRLLALIEATEEGIESMDGDEAEDDAVWEARLLLRRVAESAEFARDFPRYPGSLRFEDGPSAKAEARASEAGPGEKGAEVFWIDKRRGPRGEASADLYITPLDLSGLLRDSLFLPFETVCCVSATLSVSGGFRHFRKLCGMGEGFPREVAEGMYASPFPYRRNVLLASPVDAPMPEEEGYRAYVERALRDVLLASGGRALVLFTSYDALRAAHEALRAELAAAGIESWRQGEADRAKLLADFKADTASVLFAVDSFWEGIDAPGETLSVVVICRLPFRVPTEPVRVARAEAIEAAGGNPFMELSVPEAVTKFRQGFGRLVRRSSDRGCVVVLDSRLTRKRYGSIFLDSLPETRRSIEPHADMVRAIERFLYE